MVLRFTSINPVNDQLDRQWTVPHTTIKGICTTSHDNVKNSWYKVFLDLPNHSGGCSHSGGCYVSMVEAQRITDALEAVTRDDNLISVN
jgi:hypothetical protein